MCCNCSSIFNWAAGAENAYNYADIHQINIWIKMVKVSSLLNVPTDRHFMSVGLLLSTWGEPLPTVTGAWAFPYADFETSQTGQEVRRRGVAPGTQHLLLDSFPFVPVICLPLALIVSLSEKSPMKRVSGRLAFWDCLTCLTISKSLQRN